MENKMPLSTNNSEDSTIQYVGLSGDNISQEETVNIQASYSISKQDAVVSKGDNKKFTCNTCSKNFTQIGSLNRHKTAHTGERAFKCPLCEDKFKRKSTLDNHIRTHTGERPYVCETCFRAFAAKENLRVHKKRHTGERSFMCNDCNSTFTRNESLKKHRERGVCMKKAMPFSDKKVTSTEQIHGQIQMQNAGNVIATGANICNKYYSEEQTNLHESVGSWQDQAVSSTRIPMPPMPTLSSAPVVFSLLMEQGSVDGTILQDPVVERNSEEPLDLSMPMKQDSGDPTMLENPLVESNVEQPLDLSLPKTRDNSSLYRPRESCTSYATEDLNQGASASVNPARYTNYQQIETSPTKHSVKNGDSFLC